MKSIKVNIDKLYLDPNNYRLRSNPDYVEYPDLTDEVIVKQTIQNKTTRLISGKNNNEINDIINSIKSNGFLKVDNILVRKLQDDLGYVVIEGNRRVAALKALKKSFEEGSDIGELNACIFREPNQDDENCGVEVVEFAYDNEEQYLVLMGLRHVSGNKKWDKYNQAKLVAELHTKGYDLPTISSKIGISSSRIAKQMMNSYYAIEDYIEKKNLFDSEPSFNPHDKYMIFSEALSQSHVRDWLGWDEEEMKFNNTENKERFYKWISPEIQISDEEDSEEAFEKLSPIIINHKEVRELDEIINDNESLEILERERSITEATEQNAGYTKKKFLSELKKAEKVLANMKIGPTLNLSDEEISIIENIISLATRLKA